MITKVAKTAQKRKKDSPGKVPLCPDCRAPLVATQVIGLKGEPSGMTWLCYNCVETERKK